jgi:hypothetical protein
MGAASVVAIAAASAEATVVDTVEAMGVDPAVATAVVNSQSKSYTYSNHLFYLCTIITVVAADIFIYQTILGYISSLSLNINTKTLA